MSVGEPKALSKREFVQLGTLAALGLAVGVVLKSVKPLGRELGMTPVVDGILADVEAPVGGGLDGDVTVVVYTDY